VGRPPHALIPALVAGTLLALPAAARAAPAGNAGDVAGTPAAYAAVADPAARAWIPLQYDKGAFVDPYTRQRSRGYGVAMIGYGLLRAGERSGSREDLLAGERALRDELRDPSKGGVFDQWISALTYNYARRKLVNTSAWSGLRVRWQRYLKGLAAARLGPGSGGCFLSSTCYSNHKMVQAEAKLELSATGLRTGRSGPDDAAALRGGGLGFISDFAPSAMDRSGRASGPGPRRPLGVLADTGVWPLGYHALSTMMVARAAWRERNDLPAQMGATLRHLLDTSAALAAPDGDVGYFGPRHEQAWIPAATAYGAEVGARLFAKDRERSARYAALADRALDRARRIAGTSPSGVLAPIPRLRRPGVYAADEDVDTVATNGLALTALNLAAEVAERPRPVAASSLPADGASWYREPAAAAFAATRRGDVWFAVREQPRILPSGVIPDLSSDFGLVAAKQRTARGTWRDIAPRRPRRVPGLTSLGPRLVTAAGVGLPYGTSIRASDGVIVVNGGFRTPGGQWLRQGVRFRYETTSRGVRLRFGAQAGDRYEFTVLLRRRARPARRGVYDSVAVTSFRPAAQIDVAASTRLTSCCDARLVPATATVVAPRDGDVTTTLTSRSADATPPPRVRFGLVGLGVSAGVAASPADAESAGGAGSPGGPANAG
jgi:hypothetical protein